jgi:hypothetical protein
MPDKSLSTLCSVLPNPAECVGVSRLVTSLSYPTLQVNNARRNPFLFLATLTAQLAASVLGCEVETPKLLPCWLDIPTPPSCPACLCQSKSTIDASVSHSHSRHSVLT